MIRPSRSKFAAGLLALLVIWVVALFAEQLPNERRCRLSSPQQVEVHVSPSSTFLDNVSYSQLRDAVIERYYASRPETTGKDDQFEDALNAMWMVEDDGDPIPIQGVDGLYVGSAGAAYNLQALQEKGITHILSLTNSAPCKWPKDLFHCLHIQGIKDNSDPENRISQYFDTTLPFINDALSGGGRILVHCWKGKSRSVSTIAAYLIKHNHISADDALAQIRVTRTRAKPNKGYMEELKDFYQEQVVKPKQP